MPPRPQYDGVMGTGGREEMRAIQRKADRICCLILNDDYPMVDIEIERQALRDGVARTFPDRLWLHDAIYESRFDRLLEQWRGEGMRDR